MFIRSDMHVYQNTASELVVDHKNLALWMGLGLGKTISALTAIVDLMDGFSVNKTLVIAPLRVANTVWKQEGANWQHTKHLKFSIVTGTERQRLAALLVTADVYVINRENVKWLQEYYLKKWPFDFVVIDESSSFKSNASERFKSLRRALPHTVRMLQLTATPGDMLQIWSQIFLLDHGESLGRAFKKYKDKFFDSDYMGYNLELKVGAKKYIMNRIRHLVVSMKTEDYLEMPPLINLFERVDLPRSAQERYDVFENDFVCELNSGVELTADNAAVLTGKLLQFCNGAIYTDEFKNWELIHNKKLDILAEVAEENSDDNILVAYNFKSDLARLKKKFPHAVVMDKAGDAVEAWNAGLIKMLLVHPASAGHGLNLQKGGSLIVWFGLTWSLELYLQLVGRLYRQGQLNPVRVVHIIARGCMDERVAENIVSKGIDQEALLNAMRAVT